MRLAETGVSGAHNRGFSPKLISHALYLRRSEKHNRGILGLAHEGGHGHINDDITWGDPLDPAHHPNAFLQFDHTHVVVAAALELAAHDSGGVDPAFAAGTLP